MNASNKVVSKPIPADAYNTLVKDISAIYTKAGVSAKAAVSHIKVAAYWEIGKRIVTVEQKNYLRAQYGTHLLENLSEDLNRIHGDKGFSISNLKYMRQFYFSYPIRQTSGELDWSKYQVLSLIKDSAARKKYEEKAIKNNWSVRELRKVLRSNKVATIFIAPSKKKPLISGASGVKLSFKRGELNTFAVVKSPNFSSDAKTLIVNLGFNIWRKISKTIHDQRTTNDKPQYTYKAYVEKIIDGDTLWSQIDCGFETLTRQKLRLRAIDCPELKTIAGQKAKGFVEDTLKNCKFIVVQTHKSDKYDRYLANIFFLEGETDANVVAKEGKLLNQELLDNGLAQKYK